MKSFLTFILAIVCYVAIAQKIDFFSVQISYSTLLPHHKFMAYYLKNNVYEFNLVIGKRVDSTKIFSNTWNLQHIGLGFYAANTSNIEIFGYSLASYFYSNFLLFRKKNFLSFFSFNIGLAYLTKSFDLSSNFLNLAIGSHLNIFANTSFKFSYSLKKFDFYLGFGFTHYSNGCSLEPNLGLNNLGIFTGFNYKKFDYFIRQKITSFPKILYYDLGMNVFYRSSSHSVSNKPGIVVSALVDFAKDISPKFVYTIGADVVYDGAAKYHNVVNFFDFFSAGLHTGIMAKFGNVNFLFNQIYFFYQKYDFFRYPQRYGFRIYLKNGFFINTTLVTFFSRAMFVELGIGKSFVLQKKL